MVLPRLRFQADRRTLAFITAYYALVLLEWRAAPHGLALALLVVLTCVVSWIAAVITHNTLHSPIWDQRWANRAFQVVLSCAYGFPVSEYIPGHNLSHHRHMQHRGDVMRTTKVQFGWNLLNALTFMPRVAPDVLVANYKYMASEGGRVRAWRSQLLRETVAVWGIKIALLAIDWRKALLFIVVPHLFALWGITSVNYVQHDGCDEDSEYNHSRNFVGEWFNWLTFNNGFHGMHHTEPGLHWSLLASAHAERIHPHIDPRLEQRSLAVYLFKTFIWPGRRLRYDGKPVVLPVEGPDEDWIPRGAPAADPIV